VGAATLSGAAIDQEMSDHINKLLPRIRRFLQKSREQPSGLWKLDRVQERWSEGTRRVLLWDGFSPHVSGKLRTHCVPAT
jgi:hypothetical protein